LAKEFALDYDLVALPDSDMVDGPIVAGRKIGPHVASGDKIIKLPTAQSIANKFLKVGPGGVPCQPIVKSPQRAPSRPSFSCCAAN